MRSGILWAKCGGLTLADFGRGSRRSDSLRGVVFPKKNAKSAHKISGSCDLVSFRCDNVGRRGSLFITRTAHFSVTCMWRGASHIAMMRVQNYSVESAPQDDTRSLYVIHTTVDNISSDKERRAGLSAIAEPHIVIFSCFFYYFSFPVPCCRLRTGFWAHVNIIISYYIVSFLSLSTHK